MQLKERYEVAMEALLWAIVGLIPFGICVWLASKERGPRRPDGMNLG